MVIAACGLGCTTVPSTDRIGSVHFAVISVGKWEDFQSSTKTLQPQFDLSADSAVLKVVPYTAEVQRLSSSNIGAALSIGSKPGGSTAAAQTPNFSVSPSTAAIGHLAIIDPISQYTAATALYQEVRLLSSYLTHAVKREGYKAYVVRMQVTLLPFRRNEPYDTYANISFFPGNKKDPTFDFPVDTSAVVGLYSVPLLVTDSIEAVYLSKDDEAVRQALLGGILSAGHFGISAAAKDINYSRGRKLNSLMTVARLTDNSIRIRLGASQLSDSEFRMEPQNHNISILLLVPAALAVDKDFEVHVMNYFSFIDARTGRVVDPMSSAKQLERLAQVHERIFNVLYGDKREKTDAMFASCIQKNKAEDVKHLYKLITGGVLPNDYRKFITYAQKRWPAFPSVWGPKLFTMLLEALPGWPSSGESFELPESNRSIVPRVAPKDLPSDPEPATCP